MTVWEYKIEVGLRAFGGKPKPKEVQNVLDKFGEEGWELVSVLLLDLGDSKQDWWIYKRPVQMRKPKA